MTVRVKFTDLASENFHSGKRLGVDDVLIDGVQKLRDGDEAKQQDEDGDVELDEPDHEVEVGGDAAAEFTFNLLEVTAPHICRVGHLRYIHPGLLQ